VGGGYPVCGANLEKDGTVSFVVWAPRCEKIELHLINHDGSRLVEMRKDPLGYFRVRASGVRPGDRYFFRLNGTEDRPDPASRYQPEGVHGPSCVVDSAAFSWTDQAWKGIAFRDLIFYELHIGTFTPEGTFESAIRKLPYLKRLGITCVEIMPIAQFPGSRNWGYDGVGLYAAQNSYGGPEGFKKFVDACHREELAVCLDVVYNHLGPEGNYLHGYGPYFTKKYRTPWGDALNYDDQDCEPVRQFVIENALYWVSEYHVDSLRLDAIHGIFDSSPTHILRDLNERVESLARVLGREIHVIAESDLNDSRVIRPYHEKGYGLAGQWSDDFHHAVHGCLTGERNGYYSDFSGVADIAKALSDGFVYDGRYSAFRQKIHGNPVKDLDPRKLVVCVQNHDQVGNRAWGDRLSTLTDVEREKIAAVLLILSPNTPLLFMGQEYGEKAPFQYFIDHGDPDLVRAVREGRTREFASFGWKEIPAPESEKTFFDSRLTWKDREGTHAEIWHLYQTLMTLRKERLGRSRLSGVYFDEEKQWLAFEYDEGMKVLVSFLDRPQEIVLPFHAGVSREILNTRRWGTCGRVSEIGKDGKTLCLPSRCAWVGE